MTTYKLQIHGLLFFLDLQQHKHTLACDFTTPLKGFRSFFLVDLDAATNSTNP